MSYSNRHVPQPASRRWPLLLAIIASAFSPVAAHSALPASDYPARRIRFIVPFAAGGGQDVIARALTQDLGKALGVNIIVDNRPGANTILGTKIAAESLPDGYTILAVSTAFSSNPSLKQLPYDPTRDFVAVTQTISLPYLLTVNPSLPTKTLGDLVTLARQKPGALNYGTGGTAGGGHLAGELFKQMAGINIMHVPYRGGSNPAIIALMGNEIQAMFAPAIAAAPHVKSEKLKALATSGSSRASIFPDVPTIAESGFPGYSATGWYGIVTRAGAPTAAISRLSTEITRVIRAPDMVKRFSAEGGDVIASLPVVFQRFIRDETLRWAKVIKTAGIKDD